MNAIRVHKLGGPEVLVLEEVPDREPGPGQILIQTRAIGVNPVETYIRQGVYGAIPLPYIPGSDAAGTVEAVGDGVMDIAVGDRVYTTVQCQAAYAEKVVAEQSAVFPLADNVTFQQGASIGVPCGAAWRGLFARGHAVAGETVLVHGASGAVGIAAIQLARAAGLTVIATASSEEGRSLIKEQGAHFAIGHDDYKRIKEIRSEGVNLVLEMAADKNLGRDLEILAPHGRVVVIGSHGKTELEPRSIMGTELDIRGMTIRSMPVDEHRVMYTALSAALQSGILRPVVTVEMPLSEAAKAHALVTKGDSVGKIVLIP